MSGKLIRFTHHSDLLEGNRAGEPSIRPVTVYLPPGATEDSESEYPLLMVLAPWTNAGRTQFDWRPFKESLSERLDRLILASKMSPCIVVAPDLYTRFGGSQYIDSDFFGPHGSYIVKELIPELERRFPIKKGGAHRGVFGRSSGGYGALRLAMDFPGEFSGVACHSGDLGFEMLFRPDLHNFCDKLAKWSGSVEAFLDYIESSTKLGSADIHLLMLLGSAGFYSPDLHVPFGLELPIDLKTGVIKQDVWQRWLDHDPVVRVQKAQEGLSNLKSLYIECGVYDQYRLLYGARQFTDLLVKLNIKHRYEEFADNHSGTDYRYDVSLPEMSFALS